jgi:hypothetical protein
MEEKSKWNKPVVATFWIVYWCFFIIYVLMSRTPDYFSGTKAPGRVVDIYKRITYHKGSYVIHKDPIVSFYVDSVEYKWSTEDMNLMGWYSVGDKVTMIYNPNNPNEAYMVTFFGYWFQITEVFIAFLIVAIITLFITVVPYGYDDKVTEALKGNR